MLKSNMSSSFPSMNRFLAIKSNSKVFKDEKFYILNEIKIANCETLPERANYNLNINDISFIIDEKIIFPESLLASYINKIKNSLYEIYVFCITLAVPDYSTLFEIEAMFRSLKIAKIDSCYLIPEQAASK